MAFDHLLDRFPQIRALVVGDLMLDEYIVGTIDRISPEAPVMVVRKQSSRVVPGGAANVAKNVAALGATAIVAGIIGEDEGGSALRQSINETAGLTAAVFVDKGRATTRKTRVVANHAHQVLRIDEESVEPLAAEQTEAALGEWLPLIEQVDVVILSDYAKGVLSAPLLQALITAANQLGKPVLANVKPSSARWYRGASLLSLNRAEAAAILGYVPKDAGQAVAAAKTLQEELGVQGVLVTLGDLGMAAVWPSGQATIPAVPVEAYDVAGAGDTVLATVALGAASIPLCPDIFHLAAHTSAKVVQHVGVAVPTEIDLREIRSLEA